MVNPTATTKKKLYRKIKSNSNKVKWNTKKMFIYSKKGRKSTTEEQIIENKQKPNNKMEDLNLYTPKITFKYIN